VLQSEGSLYLAGLFLRFGVPLGFTMILAWVLRNLDLRWIEEGDSSVENEKVEEDQLPEACWIVHRSSTGNGRKAVALDPCWRIRMRFEGNLSSQCLDCQYFKDQIFEIAA
jgi:hypothetical protein